MRSDESDQNIYSMGLSIKNYVSINNTYSSIRRSSNRMLFNKQGILKEQIYRIVILQ